MKRGDISSPHPNPLLEGEGAGEQNSRKRSSAFRTLKTIGTVILYTLMLLAVLALWNNDAPQFIYVAF
jgi:hypothetical protein